MAKSLKEINKEIKIDVNEASGISPKCKQKLIKLVEKHFEVTLPKENYLNIDIELLENGNIMMRDVEYKTSSEGKTIEELNAKFDAFQEEADHLLNKNGTNFDTMKKNSERNNLIAVFFITFVIVVIGLNAIRELLFGNLFGVLWIVIMIGYYVIPATGNSIRNRYVRAWNYLRKKKK